MPPEEARLLEWELLSGILPAPGVVVAAEEPGRLPGLVVNPSSSLPPTKTTGQAKAISGFWPAWQRNPKVRW
jgi:hypothetical protein